MNQDQQLAWATAKQFAYMQYFQRRNEGFSSEEAAKKALSTVESFLLDAGYGTTMFNGEKEQLFSELLMS
ncbi:hypothetical protein [Deinococcus depolymerans]|uniref:Uncharacterized protein n=1 Tax=Deinococcus depolymerans TaxID=392408 RepID=A0ABN1BU22_9DEIO